MTNRPRWIQFTNQTFDDLCREIASACAFAGSVYVSRQTLDDAVGRLAGSAEARVEAITAGGRILAEEDVERNAWKFTASGMPPYVMQTSERHR